MNFNLFSSNTLCRILFLILTPVFFRIFNFAFIWHSIYWGVITFVVMIWMLFILISPLLGRIGCGWFCFMGTLQDLTFDHSLVKIKRKKPIVWLRFVMPIGFFVSSLTFFYINLNSGTIQEIRLIPHFFGTGLNIHYQHIWLYDTVGALLLGVFLEKRWACKNLCFIGSLCALGSTHSRLLPVIDTEKCNRCKKCEKACLINIPITDYLTAKKGLVADSECLLCGKCVKECHPMAISIKFVWNRRKYLSSKSAIS